MMANPQHRCVFVGNIPYDATEEQLVQICEEVGPVVSFRLVIDRETGKPKGYGFCEYKDEETALSARRNLHGYDINGRQLRVDFAENDKNNDKSREQGRGGPGLPTNIAPQTQTGGGAPAIHGDPSLHQALGVQVAMTAAIVMGGTLGGGQANNNTSQNGIQSQPILGTDPLTLHLAKIPKGQLIEVLSELKTMAIQNKEQAHQLLVSHPQLLKAVLQSHIMLKSIPPHLMPNARQLPGPQAQSVQVGQPSSIQPLPGPPPLGQSTMQLGPLVPSQYAGSSHSRFQSPLLAQHLGLQHSTLSGLPLTGNLQSFAPRPTANLSNRIENQMATSSSMLQYPGQNAAGNLGHSPPLVTPIQPSLPTHKPSSSFGSGISTNRQSDDDKPQHLSHPNPVWGPKADHHQSMPLRLHESASTVNENGPISHPPKLMKMEDGRGASFSPPVLGSLQTVTLSGNQNVAPLTDTQKQNSELAPGVDLALLQQVLSLTPEQLKTLPPGQRQEVIQLQQMLRHSN